MNGDRISNFSYALRYCSLSFPYFQTTEIYFHSILTITETILFIYLIYLSFPRGGKVKKIYIKYIPLYLETNQKEVIWFSSVFFLQYFDIKGRTDHIYFTRIWQHRLNAKNQTAFEINCFFHQILSAFFSVNSKKKKLLNGCLVLALSCEESLEITAFYEICGIYITFLLHGVIVFIVVIYFSSMSLSQNFSELS